MNHSTIFTKKPLVAAIGTALASSSPVVVAQTDTSDEGMLDEIIVTSTRREASIQDIPYNISAVGGDEIVGRNILDTAELMRTVSGVSVIDRGYRNGGHVNSLIIRGVNVDTGANGDVGLSAVAPVATLEVQNGLEQVQAPEIRPQRVGDPEQDDVERVEQHDRLQ